MSHEDYMKKCFELARNGLGFVSPNPMVGALIVKDGEIVGEGWHRAFGGDHAEVEAIEDYNNNCNDNGGNSGLQGATIYVSLLPCCHVGKTGACTDAIIKAGISRVVYSSFDPNPAVGKKSLEILRDAGIEVIGEILEDEGYELNYRYFKWRELSRPFFAVKMACTLDGKVATKDFESKWITGGEARDFVHSLRAQFDGILVGSSTLKHDDPNLGLHGASGREPFRFLLSSSGVEINSDLAFFRDDRFEVVQSIDKLISYCNENDFSSVLIEGGSGVFSSFLERDLVDELYLMYGPKILGNEHLPLVGNLGIEGLSSAKEFELVEVERFGGSFMVRLRA